MFEKFLFCFKQKISAVLMAYSCMTVGSIGVIYFSIKMHVNWDKFDSHFLILSICHIIAGTILIGGVVWEKPLLILVYELFYISVFISLLVYLIIYLKPQILSWIVLVFIVGAVSYWIFCVHIYYRQLRLKIKSNLSYVGNDVYSVCNKLYENGNIHMP
ncbi:hypothetical protein ABEB36_003094 [Hypothenemus hampei]|uniref:NADH dehydrogenase subunit 6 n=1 Tax=Hypothenemus hampei TaxID=57062 RepID=A0ABD1F804_HYPHA